MQAKSVLADLRTKRRALLAGLAGVLVTVAGAGVIKAAEGKQPAPGSRPAFRVYIPPEMRKASKEELRAYVASQIRARAKSMGHPVPKEFK